MEIKDKNYNKICELFRKVITSLLCIQTKINDEVKKQEIQSILNDLIEQYNIYILKLDSTLIGFKKSEKEIVDLANYFYDNVDVFNFAEDLEFGFSELIECILLERRQKMKIIKDEEYLINDSTIGVANYLVSLYKRTKNTYQYYPTKINRLLTIYKLCSLKYNDKCLNDLDFIITEDGTMGILSCMHSPFYNFYSSIPENYNEIDDEIETFEQHKNFLHSEVKIIAESLGINYEKQLYISDDSKKILELIFRKFGNYPFDELVAQINQIVNNILIRKSYDRNYIKLEDFINFMNKNNKVLKNNIIFEFIKNFDRLNINQSYDLVSENFVCSKKLIKNNK